MVRPSRILVAMLAALALVGAACQSEPEAPAASSSPESQIEQPFPLTLQDDEGVETTLADPPQRIVTFAPSHTEIVYALGLGDRLVGVSGPYDDYPAEAASVEAVAGKSGVEPNIEKVVSLEPDVLLTAFIGGEWKEQLRDLDIPVFTTLAVSFEDTLADIGTLGKLLGAQEEANQVISDIALDSGELEDQLAGEEPVTCFLDLSDLFTVGPGSLEYDLLQRAGCDPITASSDNPYPQWSLEQLVKDDPFVYLVAEGVPLEDLAKQEGIRDLTAVSEGRIFEVNSDLISRPGPRVGEGVAELAAVLHPEVAA